MGRRLAGWRARVLALPDTRRRFGDMGIEPVGSSPEDFDRFIAAEMARWGKVVREAQIAQE